MTSRPPVTAGWAVWSKQPGTRDDYSVLAFSDGPLNKGEFAQVLAHFAPGSPSAEPDTPASLPWVTFSRVGVGQELYLGISVQTATSYKDWTGRPISRTTYFCVPYAPLAGNPLSYQDLYAAVADPGLLDRAGRNVMPLTVAPLDPAALARSVRDDFGDPEMITRSAAMLLAGPVTVTGPKFPALAARLRFFDAVAALLPYGHRAHLTAATWSDAGAGDRFRLVFANRARDEASRVSWGTLPRRTTATPAAAYLGYLDRALHGTGAGRLESLIAYLAQVSEPRKFEEPGYAVDRIHDFFRPAVVAEALASGTAKLSEVRRLFADGRAGELPAPQRMQLLRRLIRGGDPQDVRLVIQWFDRIAGDDPSALLTDVAVACRARLWSSESAGLAREYLPPMTLRGLTDDLLALLVARPEAETDPVSGLEALAQLLADFVIASADGPRSFPRTQQAMTDNPAAGAALLACLAASWQPGRPQLEAAAEWLEPVADQVVAPFVALLGDAFGTGTQTVAEAVGIVVIAELDRHGEHASVRYLLRAASYRKRLHLVLPAFTGWLAIGRGEAAEQASRYWGDVFPELTPATMEDAAWLDLARLIIGGEPRALLSGRYGQPQFSQRLARAWQELAAAAGPHGATVDELAEAALTAFLKRSPWRADRAQVTAIGNLVQALTEKAPRPRLLEVALDPVEALRQMPPGAPPGKIARACVHAYTDGVELRQVAGALARSGAITSADQAAELIEHMHRQLAAAGARNESYLWPIELARDIISWPHAANFPVLAAGRYIEEMLFRIRLLAAVVRYAPSDAPPVIDAGLIEFLEGNRQELDEILKEARKRQPRGSLKDRVLGGRGSESKPPEPGEPGLDTAQPAPGTGGAASQQGRSA